MEAFLCVKCDDFHQNNWEGLAFHTIADTHIAMHMTDAICRKANTSSSAQSNRLCV